MTAETWDRQRERLNAAIDRARMERAEAEDAETAATERAESAEAKVVALEAAVEALQLERGVIACTCGAVAIRVMLARVSGDPVRHEPGCPAQRRQRPV